MYLALKKIIRITRKEKQTQANPSSSPCPLWKPVISYWWKKVSNTVLTICISFWISKVKLWKWYKEYIKCVCIYNVLFFCKWLWSLGYLSMCYVSPGWPWVIGTPISFWNAWVSHRAAQIKEKNHFLKLNQRLKVLLPENLSLSIPFFCVYTCVYLFVEYIYTCL